MAGSPFWLGWEGRIRGPTRMFASEANALFADEPLRDANRFT